MNRNLMVILLVMLVSLFAVNAGAQDAESADPRSGNGLCQFVDENGDGFNDLAPDDDGDGIPNGMDPDYEKPEDGTGNQNRYANGELNRTGVADFEFGVDFGDGVGGPFQAGEMFGPGDGSGTQMGPNDGTGFGPGSDTGEIIVEDPEAIDQIKIRTGRI